MLFAKFRAIFVNELVTCLIYSKALLHADDAKAFWTDNSFILGYNEISKLLNAKPKIHWKLSFTMNFHIFMDEV